VKECRFTEVYRNYRSWYAFGDVSTPGFFLCLADSNRRITNRHYPSIARLHYQDEHFAWPP
jgi:hypothetical protein